MTPERALEHDERCERDEIICAIDRLLVLAVHLGLDEKALKGTWRDGLCACASRALTAARQREEEAKERLAQCEASWHQLDAACQVRFDEYRAEVRQKSDMIAALTESNTALRAKNDRLTLAASESARTLQVEIAALKHGHALCDKDYNHAINTVTGERDALKDQMTALRGILERLTKESAANPKGNFYDGVRYALAALYQDGDTQ